MSFSVYHIRDFIDGQRVTSFTDVLKDSSAVRELTPRDEVPFECRLFLAESAPRLPVWTAFLEEGFDDLDLRETQTLSALLVVKVRYYNKDHYLAFTFGFGRYLMRPDAYDRSYGLRTALNLIYNDAVDHAAPTRLKSVDSKTVAANTMRTRRQTDRRATFETFGLDIQRDLLNSVTGYPHDMHYWGRSITGADNLKVSPSVAFDQIEDFCKAILRTYRQNDYQDEFHWIDNLRNITDPALLSQLHEIVVNAIKDGSGDVALAVPGILEWADVSKFALSFAQDTQFDDPEECDLTQAITDADLVDEISVDKLKKSWYLIAYDNNADLFRKWNLLRCLSGEFDLNGKTYILSDGDFHQIDAGYNEELNAFIDALPATTHVLPPSVGDPAEGIYNKLAAASSDNYLLLDANEVRVPGQTSPIEICDILTSGGAFIHVKRKLSSSSLSHLFGQGYVSADLFLMNREYRAAIHDKIAECIVAQNKADIFSGFSVDSIRPGDHEVVYAIVAKWNGRSMSEALPFFSKVNLRNFVTNLRKMGFHNCTMAAVDVPE